MNYDELKAKIAHIFDLSGEFSDINEILDKAEVDALLKPYVSNELSPIAQMRLYKMPSAAKILANYVDEVQNV